MINKLNLIALRAHFQEENGQVTAFPLAAALSVPADRFLETAYQVIDCDCVDVVAVQLGGFAVDIWVDDSGLFKYPSDPLLGGSLAGWLVRDDHGHEIPLAGTLIFSTSTADGETADAPPLNITKLIADGQLTAIGIPVRH